MTDNDDKASGRQILPGSITHSPDYQSPPQSPPYGRRKTPIPPQPEDALARALSLENAIHRPATPEEQEVLNAAMEDDTQPTVVENQAPGLLCSFCGRNPHECAGLIQGRAVMMCSECWVEAGKEFGRQFEVEGLDNVHAAIAQRTQTIRAAILQKLAEQVSTTEIVEIKPRRNE